MTRWCKQSREEKTKGRRLKLTAAESLGRDSEEGAIACSRRGEWEHVPSGECLRNSVCTLKILSTHEVMG